MDIALVASHLPQLQLVMRKGYGDPWPLVHSSFDKIPLIRSKCASCK